MKLRLIGQIKTDKELKAVNYAVHCADSISTGTRRRDLFKEFIRRFLKHYNSFENEDARGYEIIIIDNRLEIWTNGESIKPILIIS